MMELTPHQQEIVDGLRAQELEIAQLRARVQHLLKQIGDPGLCKGCGAEIWWVTHKNGKKVPYTKEGLNHFADCPERERFKKKNAQA